MDIIVYNVIIFFFSTINILYDLRKNHIMASTTTKSPMEEAAFVTSDHIKSNEFTSIRIGRAYLSRP